MTAMVRRLSHGLHSVHLAHDDLLQMIDDLANQTTDLSGISCRVKHVTMLPDLPSEVAFNLYRIVQEAVNNTVKHSHASQIVISLDIKAGNLMIEIDDNGQGLSDDFQENLGSGLRIMRHRASMIGAELSINFAKEKGSRVTIQLPL
jgi:signal transduction histidine kinase